MNAQFDEKQSIALINEMIMQARNNFQKGAGNIFLFWGYIIAILASANFVLLHTIENHGFAYCVWFLTIPVYIINRIYNNNKEKEAVVKTHIDKVIKYVWVAFFISNVVFITSIYCMAIVLNQPLLYIVITPVIMLLTGMAMLITAIACRFKPYTYGSFVFWAGSLLCTVVVLLTNRADTQFIILAASMIAGFVVPGHIANKKAE